jgi:hypothetical protein
MSNPSNGLINGEILLLPSPINITVILSVKLLAARIKSKDAVSVEGLAEDIKIQMELFSKDDIFI